MSSKRTGQSEETVSVAKLAGNPSQGDVPEEQTRWRRFLRWLNPWARKTGLAMEYGAELGVAFAEAELAKRENEVRKLVAEAASIAAERGHCEQEAMKVASEEIARIIAQDDQTDAAKKLQLANLFAANPQIAAQFEVIETVVQNLRLLHGASVEVRSDEGLSMDPVDLPFCSDDSEAGSLSLEGEAELESALDEYMSSHVDVSELLATVLTLRKRLEAVLIELEAAEEDERTNRKEIDELRQALFAGRS